MHFKLGYVYFGRQENPYVFQRFRVLAKLQERVFRSISTRLLLFLRHCRRPHHRQSLLESPGGLRCGLLKHLGFGVERVQVQVAYQRRHVAQFVVQIRVELVDGVQDSFLLEPRSRLGRELFLLLLATPPCGGGLRSGSVPARPASRGARRHRSEV